MRELLKNGLSDRGFCPVDWCGESLSGRVRGTALLFLLPGSPLGSFLNHGGRGIGMRKMRSRFSTLPLDWFSILIGWFVNVEI